MRRWSGSLEHALERLVLDHSLEMVVAVVILAPLLPLIARYAGRIVGRVSSNHRASDPATRERAGHGRPLPYIIGGLVGFVIAVVTALVLVPRLISPAPSDADHALHDARSTPAHSLSRAAQLQQGFGVAYPSDSGFEPVGWVKLGGVTAVIAQRQKGDAHADQGETAVRYVSSGGRVMRAIPGAEATVPMGSFGNPETSRIRRDLGNQPVIQVNGGGTWQGCTAQWTALIELASDRPYVLIDNIPTMRQTSPDVALPDYDAVLQLRRTGIAAVYRGGLKRTVLYIRRRNRLNPVGTPQESC